MFDNVFSDLLKLRIRGMLGGYDDGVDTHGNVVVIFNCDLSLAVGSEIRQSTVLAHSRESLCKLLSQIYGKRHERGSLVAGIAENHALVARTDVVFVGHFAFLCFKRLVDAHGDVGRLAVDRGDHRTGVAVKALFGGIISDISDSVARN